VTDRDTKLLSTYEPTRHARKNDRDPALCGAVGFMAWTDRRSRVTCEGCLKVIAERLKTAQR
jgi:hypothetical protein